MSKDWTGNNKSVFTCNGASNHSEGEREVWDYYATEPKALSLLLKEENFNKNIWEPACGELHLSNVLEEQGFNVRNSDIIDRLNNGKIEELDFLTYQSKWNGDIITNPPYKCFSSDTECYTKYGWKNWEKLKSDDEILSINPHTQEIEWSGINEIIHYNIDEDVYNFKKSHMDILCTKGHRMFAYGTNKKIQQKDNDLILSQDIRRGHYIPRTGYCWNGQSKDYFTLPAINGYSFAQPVYKKEIQIPMTDWLRFFGMWLADCFSVKKKAKINRPNRINRQEGAKKEPNFCTNFQSRQAKGNRSDCECGPCCKKRRCIQRPACKPAENPLS